MLSQKVIGILLFINLISFSEQSPVKPYFRKDYEYVSSEESFIKLHKNPLTWHRAMGTCNMEGAELAYPLTSTEYMMMTSLHEQQMSNDSYGVWIAAHDIFAEGLYLNFKGEEINSMYTNWAPGEPNNDTSDNEDCIVLTRDGKLNDYNCTNKLPFICTKKLSTLTSNPLCETYDTAYVQGDDKSRCYKIHTTPRTWYDAFEICHAEFSYLAIINSEKERDALKSMFEETQITDTPGCIFVGFNDLLMEGNYFTIHGQTLMEAGYNKWDDGQPDNYNGDNDNGENCGCMNLNGKLNDFDCSTLTNFFCERVLGDPDVVGLYSRVSQK